MSLDSRPFILYGRSQLAAYQEQMEHALNAWLQNWFKDSVATPQLAVSPLVKSMADSYSAATWYRLNMDAASIYLHFDGLNANDFFSLMLGLTRGKNVSRLGEGAHWEIVQALLNDFVSRWFNPTVTPETFAKLRWVHSTLPESLYERGSGSLLLTLSINTAIISFVVLPEVLQRLPLSAKSSANVGKRHTSRIAEVLGQESVRLFVAIDAAEKVSFSALSDLNIGDVILLNRRVQEPFNLINASGARLGGCHIGRRGENRAIHIAASSSAGNLKGISIKS